jgi:hypothetical protein
MALIDKIKAIADAIRNKTGTEDKMTLDEMAEAIEYMDPGSGGALPSTFILVDEDGYEIPAVLTEEEVELTATPNDIRIGTTAVTDTGVTTGEKEIPSYVSSEGTVRIPAGNALSISMFSDLCKYTKLQAIVCTYNTSLSNSVAAEKISVNDTVYAVNSTIALATVSVDEEKQTINLGLTNTSDSPVVIRYFTFKEEE